MDVVGLLSGTGVFIVVLSVEVFLWHRFIGKTKEYRTKSLKGETEKGVEREGEESKDGFTKLTEDHELLEEWINKEEPINTFREDRFGFLS